jgi:hypothetical protein
MSASRCVRIEGPGVLRSASTSSNTAHQYSGGSSSPGPTAGDVGGTFPRAAAVAASCSICFRVGMLAGRSVTSWLEHNKNKCRVRRTAEARKYRLVEGGRCRNHGPPFVLSPSRPRFGVPRSWPLTPTGKASFAFRSSPVPSRSIRPRRNPRRSRSISSTGRPGHRVKYLKVDSDI